MNKKNSITDLISVIEVLVGTGYSNPSLIASIGVSAGGLLLGKINYANNHVLLN
jgi:protease II